MGDLEKRMKTYEAVSKAYLMRRCPVMVRMDGKGFSKFTKGFIKPFDPLFGKVMHQTMLELCKDVPGCVLGYTQSDEITLVLCDYQKLDTQPWFNYNVEKMCSVIASMVTTRFNRNFARKVTDLQEHYQGNTLGEEESKRLKKVYEKRLWYGEFDTRVFNLPIDEVGNNLYWRQQDAERNSIEAAARSMYSNSELHKKNTSQMQDMMMEKGVNWNNYDTWKKRGCCAVKVMDDSTGREKWKLDMEIPIFTKDWEYINKRIRF